MSVFAMEPSGQIKGTVFWGKNKWTPWLAVMLLAGNQPEELLTIAPRWLNCIEELPPLAGQWTKPVNVQPLFAVYDKQYKVLMRACRGVEAVLGLGKVTVGSLFPSVNSRSQYRHVDVGLEEHRFFWPIWYRLPRWLKKLFRARALCYLRKLESYVCQRVT